MRSERLLQTTPPPWVKLVPRVVQTRPLFDLLLPLIGELLVELGSPPSGRWDPAKSSTHSMMLRHPNQLERFSELYGWPQTFAGSSS
jgi:hypothetical protein